MPKEFFTLNEFARAMSTATGKEVPVDYLRGMLCDLGIIERDSSLSFFYSEVCGLCRGGLYSRQLIHDIFETYFRPWSFFGDPPAGSNPLDSLTL
jgi:hypothetical protein